MRVAPLLLLALAFGSASCGQVTPPTEVTAEGDVQPSFAVSGIVTRGPIQPVCFEGVPCEAPFSAEFAVQLGATVVATFRSDEQGRFTLRLPAGAYVVVPDPGAPILLPLNQPKPLVIGEADTANIRLQFDTGIR